MATATKSRQRETATITPLTMESALIECEVLAIIEDLGRASLSQVCELLPHRSRGQVQAALRRQSGICLQWIVGRAGGGWELN